MGERLDYNSIEGIIKKAKEKKTTISEIFLQDQIIELESTREHILHNIDVSLEVMENSAANGGKKDIKSNSGLTGGDGYRMAEYGKGDALAGEYATSAMAVAISVAEYNAAMGKIVASPTAGSCGVLPGAIIPLLRSGAITREQAQMAVLCAGAIGLVIATQASIAGAEGGCQAECGSAAAMAAGALVELKGGTPDMVGNAVAIAIKNQLGLVCDPVAGLVEVPCIKRNAGSVMCAITAAEMALAGIKSVIPVDEVVIAMKEVGDSMSADLKETARGGLAASKTGRQISKKLFGTKESE